MSATSADVLQALKPVIVADPAVVEVTAARLGLKDRLSELLAEGSVALSPVEALTGAPIPGAVTAEAGAAAVAYARAAIRLVESGRRRPLSPAAQRNRDRQGGHPVRRLSATARRDDGDRPRRRVPDVDRPAPADRPRDAPSRPARALDSLTPEKVLSALRAVDGALRRIGIERPRIAVCGIDPHAGEDGLFGNEDAEITAPAVALACNEGIAADGPGGRISFCRSAATTPISPCITIRAISRSSWKGGARRSASRSARRCFSAPSPMQRPRHRRYGQRRPGGLRRCVDRHGAAAGRAGNPDGTAPAGR